MSREPDDTRPEAAPDPASTTDELHAAFAFEPVADALDSVGVPLSCSEAHGLACGLLCTETTAAAKSRWFTELLDAAGLDAGSLVTHGEAIRLIDRWFGSTQERLDAPDVVFEPALPPDDAPLGRRLDALGDFCAGFTYGVGIGVGTRGSRSLPDDTRELLTDFQAIDGVERGTQGLVEDADSEADYTELAEYVRVGVLLILEELKPVERPAAVRPDPHAPPAGDAAGPSTDGSQLH